MKNPNYMTFWIKNRFCFAINREKLMKKSYNLLKNDKLYDKQNKTEPLIF